MEPSKPVSITLGGSREDMLTRRGRTYVHNKRDGRLELEFQRRRRSGYSCDSGTPSLAGADNGIVTSSALHVEAIRRNLRPWPVPQV
jgi:hypothetical protein